MRMKRNLELILTTKPGAARHRFVLAFVLLLFAAGLLTLITGCGQNDTRDQADFFAMDTTISLTIFNHADSDQLLQDAKTRIEELEDMMSIGKVESDVTKINLAAGISPVTVHPETFHVIETALSIAEITDGAFDVSIYPLVTLWRDALEQNQLPADALIEARRTLVNYENIILDSDQLTVFLKESGMGIDLGGIAKGYIGDQVYQLLYENDVKHALINLGGDVLVLGSRTDGSDWRIGVADPRATESASDIFAVVETTSNAVMTSGDYMRYGVIGEGDNRYHHILDPVTGFPAEHGTVSVTIVSESAMIADALATAFFNMPASQAMEIVESLPEIEAILITEDRDMFVSGGIADKVSLYGEEEQD